MSTGHTLYRYEGRIHQFLAAKFVLVCCLAVCRVSRRGAGGSGISAIVDCQSRQDYLRLLSKAAGTYIPIGSNGMCSYV